MKINTLILLSLCIFTACRNIDTPSNVDPKPFNYEENMDKSVKPGDDFFMYSNGAWWNKTNLQGEDFVGFVTEVEAISNQRVANLNNSAIKEFWSKVANIDNTSQEAEGLLKEHLKLFEDITTSEQANKAIIKAIITGYNLVAMDRVPENGTVPFVISFSWDFFLNFDWLRHSLMQLGCQDPDARISYAKTLYNVLKKNQSPIDLSLKNIENNPQVLDKMVALNSTKASGSVLLNMLIEALKVDINSVQIDAKMVNFFLELEKAEPEAVKYLLQMYVADKYKFTSRTAYSSYQRFEPKMPDFKDALDSFKMQYMRYLYSYAYTQQYISAEQKNKMSSYCEEIRTAFNDRIGQISWMSETTKQKAKAKLQAMSFNVASPNTWIESALPKSLKGASMLEDMFTLSVLKKRIYEDHIEMSPSEIYFHVIMALDPIESFNAMYVPYINAMYILPVWLQEPLYDESKSDAYNYANLVVVGHEITHGFDQNGAKYNKIGESENWWTVADQMEFASRQQNLVDCYNLLEILPKELPNVFTDGRLTLGENIADLGGFQMVFAAYNSKLLAQGYSGEELRKQHKKILHAYANLWRNKYSASFALFQLANDAHALSKKRINGVVMNLDIWYDLYDVKWGDKLYLKPEKRTYIW